MRTMTIFRLPKYVYQFSDQFDFIPHCILFTSSSSLMYDLNHDLQIKLNEIILQKIYFSQCILII